LHSDQFKRLIHSRYYLKFFLKFIDTGFVSFKTNNFLITYLIHVKLNDMKNLIDKNNRKFKNVFSKTTISQIQNSKYPLGEDFYSIQTDEKALKDNEISQIESTDI